MVVALILAVMVVGVNLVVRLSSAAARLQTQSPLATPFIGLLLAASEFSVGAVFAVLARFVPGTRWARLWAVYHFISGLSASYHGSSEFWHTWRPLFALIDATEVACVAGGIAEYVGRRVDVAKL